MVALSRGIVDVITIEYGKMEFIKRISDPFWFQALSCVLGYDWHSSGTTTVTCGALKEAVNINEHGFAIAGGKGKTSRKTPDEIKNISKSLSISDSKIKKMIYASRMAAKIDNTAVQDEYNLYHHVFFFTEDSTWGVIQQGMNNNNSYARRYHWFSENINSFIYEPHESIIGLNANDRVLDMTSKNSIETQKISLDLVNDNPSHLKRIHSQMCIENSQSILDSFINGDVKPNNISNLFMPRHINWERMRQIYEFQPKNYEEMLSFKGVGPNTVRALALISDLIYGEAPSWKDPVKYSFTVGGKDGVPFPVDKKAMDESIEIISNGISQAKVGNKYKLHAIKRLKKFTTS
jgi:hypothetical protein